MARKPKPDKAPAKAAETPASMGHAVSVRSGRVLLSGSRSVPARLRNFARWQRLSVAEAGLQVQKSKTYSLLGSLMIVLLIWLTCALLPAAGAAGNPAPGVQALLLSDGIAHSLVVEIAGRKGTRNYQPDDVGAPAEPKNDAALSAEGASDRKVKLEQCLASWDSKTHIAKSNWRKICERQLSDE